MPENRSDDEPNPDTHAKWFNSPVMLHRGNLNDIRKHLPAFERREFDSQIFAWPAKERRDVQERLEWRERIPAVLGPRIKESTGQ